MDKSKVKLEKWLMDEKIAVIQIPEPFAVNDFDDNPLGEQV